MKSINIKLSLLCGLVLATVLLMTQSQPAEAVAVWEAKYYNNMGLWGEPVLVRNESGINNDWGYNSPSDEILANYFSAEWTTVASFNAGTYRFYATADDGMRVYVNDELIIDVWYDSQQHTTSADLVLTEGTHSLKVQYYDNSGLAMAKVNWEAVTLTGAGGAGWTAQYYNNTTLSGDPAVTQTESQISYIWLAEPVSGVSADRFSVRWTADVNLAAGTYRFTTRTDDGVRLWVGGQQIIDQWGNQPETAHTADITVSGGTTQIVMEYFENDGVASANLSWSQFSATTAVDAINNSSSQVITDWRGEYFANTELSGTPAVTRNDPAINWSWGSSSPIPNILSQDNFSVRWTQTVSMSPGSYIFRAYADDGVRVYINDQEIINHWAHAYGDWHTAVFTIETEGDVNFRVEYLEFNNMAEIIALWEPFSGSTTDTASDTASDTTTESTQPTASLIPDAYALSIRTGPGHDFDIAGYLISFQEVILLGRDAETYWIKIQHPDGTIGWSSGRFLSSTTDFSTLPLLEE